MNHGSFDNSTEIWRHYLTDISPAEEPAIQRLINKSRYLELPAQFQISSRGAMCADYIVVMHGDIRVQVVTEKGREVVLYHVRAGEGCVLTTSCLLSRAKSPAEGFTDTKTALLALPAAEFDHALGALIQFRNFVFDNFAQRLAGVISRFEQLCTPAIDRRLASALLDLSNGSSEQFAATHQQLAAELGTAREVVSRHLKHYESKGWLRLGRGTVQIFAPEELIALTLSQE
ncbi:MAG: Crp/Fnr family transcriptional regulator [Gammaproteobacteria bacterium]|nr:Crp/Fnr family transcriptional regulator [Gammaproteobacteria bacterium]